MPPFSEEPFLLQLPAKVTSPMSAPQEAEPAAWVPADEHRQPGRVQKDLLLSPPIALSSHGGTVEGFPITRGPPPPLSLQITWSPTAQDLAPRV